MSQEAFPKGFFAYHSQENISRIQKEKLKVMKFQKGRLRVLPLRSFVLPFQKF